MARRIAEHRRQDGRIGHHGRAGDGGQADHHHQEQLRAGQLVQIGADDDGALDHAQEDVGRHRQGRGPAQAHGALEQEAEAQGDPLEDLPVPQQGRQGRDHQDQRQHLEGEGEQRSLVLHRIGLIAAGQEAEDEPGPLLGRQLQAPNRVVDAVQHHLRAGDGEGRQHQGRLNQHRPHRQPPGEDATVLGDRPADGDDDDQAEQALEVQEAEHEISGSATGAMGAGFSNAHQRQERPGWQGVNGGV
ncbi:hypothetical protein D3C73_958430 [compost metagenome]